MPLGSTLHDIAQTLESTAGSGAREVRVLELLQRVVPYEQCALFHAQPGREPRLVIVPPSPLGPDDPLSKTVLDVHRLLVDERAHPQVRAKRSGMDLAVPLVGDDQVIGVLLVRGATSESPTGGYTEQHLRDLAIVGAHLTGYLVMVDKARALDEGRRAAETANRLKDTFLALVSRALKTTLISTLASASRLRSEALDSLEYSRAVDTIERNAHLQAKRVDELLELSCVMSANPHLALAAVEPATLVEAAVENQRQLAERRSIRVEATVDESLPPIVVDPDRIVRVISNILANAIQYSPPGGAVDLQVTQAGAHARIQVIDHGIGILHDDLPHLFEPFRGNKNPLARTYGELGGGLAIVKPLVESHGGRVWAESQGDQKGATLTIELPLATQGAVDRPLDGVRVLLVDDDIEMRLAARLVLEHFGAEVTTVSCVAAALEALERSRPHVLLSDLRMPGESGYDLIRKVAVLDATLPAAAMTASSAGDERSRALAAGFRTFLAKPFAAWSLVKAVADLAERPIVSPPLV
jgi:signal transduction histidine kinase